MPYSDVSGYGCGHPRQIAVTADSWDQIRQSLDAVQAWWLRCLQRGFVARQHRPQGGCLRTFHFAIDITKHGISQRLTCPLTHDVLYSDFVASASRQRTVLDLDTFKRMVKQLAGIDNITTRQRRFEGAKQTMVWFADLNACRTAFERLVGFDGITWEDCTYDDKFVAAQDGRTLDVNRGSIYPRWIDEAAE